MEKTLYEVIATTPDRKQINMLVVSDNMSGAIAFAEKQLVDWVGLSAYEESSIKSVRQVNTVYLDKANITW